MLNDSEILELFGKQMLESSGLINDYEIIAFARLIEAATREECAKVVESIDEMNSYQGHHADLRDCAAAIREGKCAAPSAVGK